MGTLVGWRDLPRIPQSGSRLAAVLVDDGNMALREDVHTLHSHQICTLENLKYGKDAGSRISVRPDIAADLRKTASNLWIKSDLRSHSDATEARPKCSRGSRFGQPREGTDTDRNNKNLVSG